MISGHPKLKLWIKSDNDVLDYSGNAKNGTLVNTPSYVAGEFGSALSYATNQAVSIGAIGAANNYNVPYTIVARVYIDPAAVPNLGLYAIVANGNGGGSHAAYWNAYMDVYRSTVTDIRIRVMCGRAQYYGPGIYSSNLHGTPAGWYNIVHTNDGVTDSSDGLQLFINGVNDARVANNGVAKTAPTAYDNWQIGRSVDKSAGISEYATLIIDEVMIFSEKFEKADCIRLSQGLPPLALTTTPIRYFADVFGRADGNLASPWVINAFSGFTLGIATYSCRSATAQLCSNYYNVALANDQFVQATIAVLPNTGHFCGVMLRHNTSNSDAYWFRLINTSNTYTLGLFSRVSADFNYTSGAITGVATNMLIRLEARGTQITGKYSLDNGITWITVSTQTGTTLTSGVTGLFISNNTSSPKLDNFLCGDL